MKVLITGGCGFIGSHVADRFEKEGFNVSIIDNLSTGVKDNVKIKHKLFKLNIEDERCEAVFSEGNFDYVIHLAANANTSKSIEVPIVDASTNILGLINMLKLSKKYNVKKFLYASTASVYGDNSKIPINEEDECAPISPYGISKLAGEKYCRLWKDKYELMTISLRLSNVYGPRESRIGEGGVIGVFFKSLIKNKKEYIFGDGTQTRDFIFVGDAVDAIFKASEYNKSDVINISSNIETSINDLVEGIKLLDDSFVVEYSLEKKGESFRNKLDNARAINELNWIPRNTFSEGLSKTYEWYKHYLKNYVEEDELKEKKKIFDYEKYSYVFPYIENIAVFITIFFLERYLKGKGIGVVVDLKLAYIFILGVVHGLKQSSIAAVLSCLLLIVEIAQTRGDILSNIYNANTLIYFSIYFFFAGALGYTIDSNKAEMHKKDIDLEDIQKKFTFLFDIYEESKNARKELESQIKNSEDSFAKIYSYTSELENISNDNIYEETISVIGKIMKEKDICIYSVVDRSKYLRLASCGAESQTKVMESIEVVKYPEIEKMIEEGEIYVNIEFDKEMPMLMAPISRNDKVIAVCALNTVEFNTLSLYRQNLFKVAANLVAPTIIRAYEYDEVMSEEQFIKGTRIFKEEYFADMIESRIVHREKRKIEFTMLKMIVKDIEEATELSYKLDNMTKKYDFIGMGRNNDIYLLLSDTKLEDGKRVVARLGRDNMEATISEESEFYESISNSAPLN